MKKITVFFAALLFFLLPLKFGGLAVMPESGGFYPENYLDWLFITFPPHSIGLTGAVLLVMAAISFREKLDKKQLIFALSWSILPALAVLPGMIRGDSVIALGELSLLLGCGSMIAAASLILNKEPDRAMLFAGAESDARRLHSIALQELAMPPLSRNSICFFLDRAISFSGQFLLVTDGSGGSTGCMALQSDGHRSILWLPSSHT